MFNRTSRSKWSRSSTFEMQTTLAVSQLFGPAITIQGSEGALKPNCATVAPFMVALQLLVNGPIIIENREQQKPSVNKQILE
jgi:hypothetical protein